MFDCISQFVHILFLCKCYGLTTMNHMLNSWFASFKPHLREALFAVWNTRPRQVCEWLLRADPLETGFNGPGSNSGERACGSSGRWEVDVLFQSPRPLLLVHWVVTELFESVGLGLCLRHLSMQVSLCKHRVYPQGCCDECFYVKRYRFVFTFNYLLGFF